MTTMLTKRTIYHMSRPSCHRDATKRAGEMVNLVTVQRFAGKSSLLYQNKRGVRSSTKRDEVSPNETNAAISIYASKCVSSVSDNSRSSRFVPVRFSRVTSTFCHKPAFLHRFASEVNA